MFATCFCCLKVPPGPTWRTPVPTPYPILHLHFTYLCFFPPPFLSEPDFVRLWVHLGAHRAVSASLTNHMKGTHMRQNGTENRTEQKGPTRHSQSEITDLAEEEDSGNTQEQLSSPGESQVHDTSVSSWAEGNFELLWTASEQSCREQSWREHMHLGPVQNQAKFGQGLV